MSEQERLNLVSAVEDEFSEPLERLENSLDSVDDEIRQTGGGTDKIQIDTEVTGVSQAIGELQALDSAISAINDDITLSVDTDFDNVLDDDVRVNSGGRGSQFINEETGQFTSANNALDRQFSDISNAIEDELSATSDVSIDAGHVDVDAASTTGTQTPAMPDGDSEPAMATSGGTTSDLFTGDNADLWRDTLEPFFDEEEFARRGGEVTRAEDLLDRDISELVELDEATRRAFDSNSNIDFSTLQGLTSGPDDFISSLDTLDKEGLTLLGEDGLKKDTKRLTKNFQRLRFTMGTFHNILAGLMPLMGVFIGAIPAAVVGLGALATAAIGAAAALGGIGALGAMGIMLSETGELNTKPIRERLSEVSDSFVEAFSPLAQQFAPVVNSAIDEVDSMMGPLATASAGLMQFRDEFKATVGFITSNLPSFIATALAFSDAAMPLLTGVMETVSGMNLFGYLATQLHIALPALVRIGSALMQILPAVVNLSQGFLEVASVLSLVIGRFSWLLNLSPMLTTVLGGLLGTLLVLVTATTLYSIAQQGLIGTSLGLAKSLFVATGAKLKSAAASAYATMANWGLFYSMLAVISATVVGIAVVGVLADRFGSLAGNAANAREELEKFASVNNGLNTISTENGWGGQSNGNRGSSIYQDNSTTVIYADGKDSAARQQYSSSYEQKQHVDSIFGG